MLEKVRLALRRTDVSLDSEILDLIEGAKQSLQLSGVVNIDESDPLIIRAIILYAKANYSFSSDSERFQIQYTRQRLELSSNKKYTVLPELEVV